MTNGFCGSNSTMAIAADEFDRALSNYPLLNHRLDMLTSYGALYILGGRQRRNFTEIPEEWHLYDSALVLMADSTTRRAKVCIDYKTPAEARSDVTSSVLFKSGSRRGNMLYICTSTEVLIYELPSFKQVKYLSLPCFNDLHHVRPTSKDTLLVTSTGLDMVIECTMDGEVLREWNALGRNPWERFSKETDYRKVTTTKPHQAHPNFVFYLKDELWVTRFEQKDAISLERPDRRIEIGIEIPHDGVIFGNQIYFTTVDGHVVIVDTESLSISEIIDLNTIDNESGSLLGWCRGLMVIEEGIAWVGFTRVRNTEFKEKILWAKKFIGRGALPARVTLYDLKAGKKLNEINLESYGMNAVFGILPADERVD